MNVFPYRKTVLHYFVENCEKNPKIKNQQIVTALFETCKKGFAGTAEDIHKNVTFEIPMIVNCHGQTPIDNALKNF